jgi:hypothetical protein
MAVTINASTSGAGGLITTADSTGILTLQTAAQNAITIDSSQNVGIGTTTPTEKLSLGGSTALYASLTTTGGIKSAIGNADSGGYGFVGNVSNHPFTFVTNNTEKVRIDTSGNVGIGVTPTGTSLLHLAAGTTAKAPFELTTGPLMTTAEGGAFEYLTNVSYFTPTNNSRAVIATEHFVARTGTKTMTSNTSLQSIFGGGTGGLTNGALTVDASTSYYFECLLSVTSMSATTGNFGFSLSGGGTATFTSAGFFTTGYDNTTLTTPGSGGGVYNGTSAITTNIVIASTTTGAAALIKGIFRINGGGTIIPSIQLTTAAAAVIGADSWFKCNPVGTNTVVSVGNWS